MGLPYVEYQESDKKGRKKKHILEMFRGINW
jgi:hypothetical protein